MSNAEIDAQIKTAIHEARIAEKLATREARRRFEKQLEAEVADEHEAVISAISHAVLLGWSARQIGKAYGSSDPITLRTLIQEAREYDGSASSMSNHPEWRLTRDRDAPGMFTITAYALGDNKLSGVGTFRIDDDGENFSLVDGDMFIQVQLYKLGFRDDVIREARLDV
jgi:hypothetical protein